MIWSSVITGIAAIIAAAVGLINRHKLNQVHVLVNSRLDATLTEIADLKLQRDITAGIKDSNGAT